MEMRLVEVPMGQVRHGRYYLIRRLTNIIPKWDFTLKEQPMISSLWLGLSRFEGKDFEDKPKGCWFQVVNGPLCLECQGFTDVTYQRIGGYIHASSVKHAWLVDSLHGDEFDHVFPL